MKTNNVYFLRSSPMITEVHPRRNSYERAIHTSKEKRSQSVCSSSSSLSSTQDYINTTRSLYTLHDGCSYCINEHIQRSLSQPAAALPDKDFLLEHAKSLLDSPVHALHSNSRQIFSTEGTVVFNEEDVPSQASQSSIYRIVFLRSFASMFVLASLYSIEALQTSIYSVEHSFQSLLTFNLSCAIAAFLFAAHASHIQLKRHRWKISNVLAYDRCSQILIIFSTIFTSTWLIMQYFHFFYYFLLLSACLTGICLSCMTIKTFDHLLQLSTSLPIASMKLLTGRLNRIILIYNTVCHLALALGGVCLLLVIRFQQWRSNSVLVGYPSCFLKPCFQRDENEVRLKIIPIHLTMYSREFKQVWINEPTRYLVFLSLILLIMISLIIQAGTEWTTSILSMSRRLSVLYYASDDALDRISKITRYRYYFLALFIGFQEGYLFGSVIKFDVTCLYGLRHTVEMLIIYGSGATISSALLALLIKKITLMTSISFATLLHSFTLVFFYLIRIQYKLADLQPLMLHYILFFAFGVVLGLWSTISIHSVCNATKFSSSSAFAQSLAFRYLGRVIAYTCTLLLCQSLLLYINGSCLLSLFSLTFICYCCCH